MNSILNNINNYSDLKNSVISANKSAISMLLNGKPFYIFGAGEYGQFVLDICNSNGIKPLNFIDNKKSGTEINGKKVISIDEIEDKDALIITASYFSSYYMHKQLLFKGFENTLNFVVLLFYFDYFQHESLLKIKKDLLDIVENKNKYIESYNLFKDDESKELFSTIINYRTTLDFNTLKSTYLSRKNIYFENGIINLSTDEVFVDGGAYDGSTSLDFINRTQNSYKKIYVFEPCESFMQNSIQSLKNYKNIEFVKQGIFETAQNLYFNDSLNYGSKIEQNGNVLISTATIDEVAKEDASFIKFDIEGNEASGLKGAKQTIIKNKPKLAICLYHKPEDLWEIPLLIKEFNPLYNFHLRYYESICEIVVYAV
ncbi:MAG: FkbM family methyltransferase [Candidatus Gastranaerophilaceae bacterium]|jgi:FkbM family methyltransferase